MEGAEDDSFASSIFTPPPAPIMSEKHHCEKKPNGMAPTAAIDVVSVGRPMKVLALLLIIFATIFFFLGCASATWLNTPILRVGLWEECYVNASLIPENTPPCNNGPCRKDYSLVCGIFSVTSVAISFLSAVCLGIGMQTVSLKCKLYLYNICFCFSCIASAFYLVPLVGFPLMFLQDLLKHRMNMMEEHGASLEDFWWTFGWAYAMGWVGIIISLLGLFVLKTDKTTEEIIYHEKVCRSESGGGTEEE